MADESTESESGPSRIQQFVTIVAMLATVLVVLLGGTFALGRGFADQRHTIEDQCKAIAQLDRNLRFYEQAIAANKDLAPPPQIELTC